MSQALSAALRGGYENTMKTVIQRVSHASVTVDGSITGEIDKGFMILLGVAQGDTEADCEKLADKISKLRIFADENDKTNLSINDIGGDILVHPACGLSPRQQTLIHLRRQAR